jgi:glycosyltransferase involved in cell wall biosynthesis
MARVLLDAATRAYVSTEAWRQYLTPRNGATLDVLPIPSNVRPASASDGDRHRRAIAPGGEPIVGHFGTYGDHVDRELHRVIPAIAERCPTARFAFVGTGSAEFVSRIATRHRDIAARSWASGRLDAGEVSSVLRACAVLIQPYPDGITTRRTSAMAGLQHGVPTVSTSGALTESIWTQSCAVALAPCGDPAAFAKTVAMLLGDRVEAQALGRRGADTYERHFSLERTVAVLRAASARMP